ncbi:integrase_H2C2 domain-containing protein [Nephila pilipes]|uniref:Integrase_H2C2 domain-containing protein n=1 Tax=Nephila pilipes TaxID=299642 RepID=A0A8X6MP72_NEPPI|nr:integrase_H2C2 domain-containing protein [Nephila pilipes]
MESKRKNHDNFSLRLTRFNPALVELSAFRISLQLFLYRFASKDLIVSEKWWHGPEWLKDPEDLWPKEKILEHKSVNSEVTSEYKSYIIVSSAIIQEKILDPNKFSCLFKMLRVTAWVLRFINALKKKNYEKDPLTSDELNNAELFWVKIVQNDSYSK